MHSFCTPYEPGRVRPFAASVGALVAALLLVGCGKESSEQAEAPVHPKGVRPTEKVVIGLLHPKADTKPEKKIVDTPRPRIQKKRILEFALQPAQTGALVDLSKSAVATLLETRLLKKPKLAWVERTSIDKVVQEQELQAAFGAESTAQRVKLGKLLKADLMILVRGGKSPDPKQNAQLEVVVFETQRGLRLTGQRFSLTNKAEADAEELERLVNQAIAKQTERISDVCAVPPFHSNDLEYRFDYLKEALGRALGQHLLGRPGVLLVELAEAKAISKELALADPGATVERKLPVYFLGEFRSSGKENDRRLSIGLKLMRGPREVGAASRSGMSIADAPRVLCEMADTLADKVLASGAAESDPDTEVEQLKERAAMLQKYGDWENCLALLEASLLLKPDEKATRLRALTVCCTLIKNGFDKAHKNPNAAYGALNRYRRALEHHEIYALPSEPVNPPQPPGRPGESLRLYSREMSSASSTVLTYRPPTDELAALQREIFQAHRQSFARLARARARAYCGDEYDYMLQASRGVRSMAEYASTLGSLVLELQDLRWAKERTLRVFGGGFQGQRISGWTSPEILAMIERLSKEGNDQVRAAATQMLAEYRITHAEALDRRAKAIAQVAKERQQQQKPIPPDNPQSAEVEFQPVNLIWEAANGKLVPVPRIIGCLPIRDNLDVVFDHRAVLLMKTKGRLRLIWTGYGSPYNACYDGRYVWIPIATGFRNPCFLLVLDPETGTKWEVTPTDGLIQVPAQELPTAYTYQHLSTAPLGPGRICLAGTIGRTWIAIATFDPAKGASIKVFHEAREVQDDKDAEQGKRTTVAFAPGAMHTLRSEPDATGHVAQRVLIARKQMHAPYGSWPPLVVDPDKLSVEVTRPSMDVGDLSKSVSRDGVVYCWWDKYYPRFGYGLCRVTYPGKFEEAWLSIPEHGHLQFLGDRINVAAEKWWTGSLARKELHPVRAMPPEVEGVFPSAHYGLLFTSYDRSRNKLTTYSVAFQPEDPFRLANKKSLVEMVALKSPYDHLQIDAKKSIREPDGTAHFTITMSLDEGWYVYADHPGLESLKPFRFQAAIEGNIASGRASIPLPLGIPVEDSQGRKWRKYDGKLVFGGCIRPDGANAATVEGIRLRVTYVLSNGQTRLPVHSKVVDVK